MRSAQEQAVRARSLVRIACSVERLKRLITKAAGRDPDVIVPKLVSVVIDYTPNTDVEEAIDRFVNPETQLMWETVSDDDVARYVNFANVFLYAGNATIVVVEKEPDPKVQIEVLQ
jgi:hypothetical protein